MDRMNAHRYVYAATSRGELGDVEEERLGTFTERHSIALAPLVAAQWRHPVHEMKSRGAPGVVLEMIYGWPSRVHLRLARSALAAGGRVFFYWPREEAIEAIDGERLGSYWRLWLFVHAIYVYVQLKHRVKTALANRLPAGLRSRLRPYYYRLRSYASLAPRPEVSPAPDVNAEAQLARVRLNELARLEQRLAPVAINLSFPPSAKARLAGVGAYLRMDFWAKISSGGSYGHTCYVAKELAASTEQFVAFVGHRYTMLDEMRVRQVLLRAPGEHGNEHTILTATSHYHGELMKALAGLRPRYLYERVCLGNYVGARLSRELGVPYIAEYNGSEISMMRSFAGRGYTHEDVYLASEMAAFRQATVISVISKPIAEDLAKRGIDPSKILVNPNGVDIDAYAPMDHAKRERLRRELGYGPEHRVICFTGTFGGWHGVDVLAAAIPRVLAAMPNARFLLIGDGNFKHLVDDAVKANRLEDRVKSVGRVPQMEGARLLGAADIYVSPHASHMVDSRFFGSPTKLFEYMAMGGGIVASSLEQIGEVLTPGLDAKQLPAGAAEIRNERAILCAPGDIDQFVAAVSYAARFPEVASALGRNARAAAIAEYSWRSHVDRLWQFVYERGL